MARHDILALRLTLTLAGVRLAREPIISKGFNVNFQAKVRNQSPVFTQYRQSD